MSPRTARPHRGNQLVAVFLLTLASAASALAQGHDAPLERGFAADRVFALGDIDHVDLSSGNVVLTIPLGISYPVNGGFSYSMKLIYNSSVWDFKESETAVCYDGTIAYYCPMLKAIPARQSNAGMGWSLSLGQLLDENDPENPNIGGYTYVAPDGTMSTYATCSGDADCGNRYPKDGQRLRFRHPAMGDDDRLSVDHPDGTVSTFECHEGDSGVCSTTDTKWWLKMISDQHGNWVKVSYDTWDWTVPGTSTTIACPRWTITDNAGGTTGTRNHYVYFRPNVTDSTSPYFSYHVDQVVLSAFGGTSATYQFAYTFPRVHRSYNDIDNSSCEWLNDGVGCDPPEDRVPFLTSVTLPDGSSFSMPDYYLDAPTYQDGPNTPGILKKLVLPTGGAIGWEHQRWDYVATEIEPPSCQDDPGTPLNDCFHHMSNRWSGIKKRHLYGSATAALPFATWTYSTATTFDMFPDLDDYLDRERRVVVVDPNSNASVYYFRAAPQWLFTPFETWDYALPFTTRIAIDVADDPSTSPIRYLSEEHFQGGVTFDASGQSSGTVKRSKYVRYEPEGVVDIGTEYRSINRRLVSQTTVYHEGTSKYSSTVDFAGFDGLGNVRTTTEQGGAFGGMGWSRESFTGYNPKPLDSGYPTYALGRAPESGEVRWGLDQPWVISTFDAHKTTLTEIVNGSPEVSYASTEQCVPKNESGFPTSGFVTRRRVLKADTARGTKDLVTVLDEDGDSRGNVAAEKYYGGDSTDQTLPVDVHVCSITLPTSPKYRIDHTYSYGALATSRYNGQSWYLVDNAVDQATGLVATSHASSTMVGTTYDPGISTYFTYDEMGRLLTQVPDSGHDARIRHEYFRYDPVGTPADPAPRVESCSFPNPLWASTCRDSLAVARSSVRFDGHGRPAIEKTRLPDSGCESPPCWQWNQRLTEYTPMGWKASVSEWQPNNTSGNDVRKTVFAYDPFGRVTSVTPPDDSDHVVTTAYTGAHQVARTVKVFTGTSEESSTTTELYDRLGQLVSVTEPSNAGNAFTTTYGYDVGGRLKGVKSTLGSHTQTRTFTYDRRGFLHQETLPEKGSNGNTTVSYLTYDARGHLLKKYDGGYSTFAYDAAERLIAACDTSATCTTSSSALLKAMTYASTNVAGTPANWRAGKLETATAVNRAFTLPVSNNTTSGTTTVTETYTYAGRGGRVSTKATAVTLAGAPSGNFSQSFTQSFRWTELGQLDALTYPTCVAAACTNTTTRSVVNAYQGGRLVAVGPYYATEITYHPNGMLKQVTHARRGEHVSAGVAERVDADPNAMGRPYRIYTDGATLPGSTFNVEGDWSNGYYSYDGAGNIKKLLKVSGSSTDTLKPGDDTFTYDKVSRLTQARIATGASTTVSQAYVYDAWGNLTSYGGQPRTIEPSYPTSNHLDDASYDAAGNQTGWIWDPAATPEPRYTYIYDYDRLNQMRYVNGPDGQHRVLAYSADGERIVERDLTGGITTFTLRGLDGALLREVELQNGVYAWVKDYVYRDGQLLASQDRKEGHQHYHLDHLGTTRMLTNRCGERVKRYEQFPFGDTISAPDDDTEKRRFTGHQRDIGSLTNTLDDMDYMHARYYGMKMGRFVSVDAGEPDAWMPGSWNRYSYAYNSPTGLVDPDGQAPVAPALAALPAAGPAGAAAGFALGAVALDQSLPPEWRTSTYVKAFLAVGAAYQVSVAERLKAAFAKSKSKESDQSKPPADASGETTTPPPPSAPPEGGDRRGGSEKKPKPRVGGKEGAKDIPSWAKGQRPRAGESGKEFARRLLDEKYGPGNWRKGPGSEYSKLQKYGDRAFQQTT
ncbi:MAG: RHS repeat-associated core domain-containing protein [Thermoanaerobaculaceae bacterium]